MEMFPGSVSTGRSGREVGAVHWDTVLGGVLTNLHERGWREKRAGNLVGSTPVTHMGMVNNACYFVWPKRPCKTAHGGAENTPDIPGIENHPSST